MSIRDQDIMVLHPTIPNPTVIPDQAIVLHLHTIPNPMVTPDQAIAPLRVHTIPNPTVIPDQAIAPLHLHTTPNPTVIPDQADKWWPVISPPKHRWSRPHDHLADELGSAQEIDTSGTLPGIRIGSKRSKTTDRLGQNEST
jgi:hypothetical protein